MEEVFKFLVAICVVLLGFPIGNLLAKHTKEELASGKKWFKLIIFVCTFGVVFGLVFQNDALLFTSLFIIVVTSRSLIKRN